MSKVHSFKVQHIILSLAIFVVWAFFGIFTSQAAQPLPFGDVLTWMYPNIESNYSSIRFIWGGNNFAGMFFRTPVTILWSPVTISVQGWTQQISCSQRVNGIYYNNQRWRRIRPLDTGNRQTLINWWYPEYSTLQITGWLYTNCSGVSGYTPASNEVYGQITHTRSGTVFYLLAWLNYNTWSNDIVWTSFGHTLQWPVASGYIFDSYGGIGYVWGTGFGTMLFGNGTGICLAFSVIPNTIVQGNNTTFTCQGNLTWGNIISWYSLQIRSGTTQMYSGLILTWVNQYLRTTWNALPAGYYNATCEILGSGDWAGGICDWPKYFTVTTWQQQWSGNCGFQGNIAIITVPWITVRRAIGDTYYTKTTWGVDIQIRSTVPSYYTVFSTEMISTVTGTYNYTYDNLNPIVNTGKIYLTTGDGIKQINSSFTTGSCTYIAPQKYITLDLLPPTAPTLLSPIDGTGVCYAGNFNLSWIGAYDSGVGITSYQYNIAKNTSFTNIVLTGTATWTTASINPGQLGVGYFTGNFYREVAAIDGLWQTGTFATWYFTVGIGGCSNAGNIMIHGTIPRIRNADLNKEYLSDPFTVDGLPWPLIAYIDTGILLVNGTGNSNSGYIDNGYELNIKLRSSTQYDTTVSTIFYVGPRFAHFYITTRSLTGYTPTSGCVLDTGQRLIIENIFDMMRDNYNENASTLADFLFTIQSMLQDETDLTDNCSLEYLLNTVNSYIMDNLANSEENGNMHEAPNCKEYEIKFVSSKSGYTSPDFKHKQTYFVSRDAIVRYIDSRNPGDCNINTYEDLPEFDSNSTKSWYYAATNGKIYQIKDKESNWVTLYYSPNFIKAKNFENKDDLYAFIDTNNPIEEIRDHEVDKDFDPEIYTAPNDKEYKIYWTDQGFMSYKLMKVQYFDTLEEIKAYIDKNNRV